MKTKTKVARWLLPYSKGLKVFSMILNIITVIVLLLWVFKKPINLFGHELDWEPLLGLLSVILLAVNQLYKWLLAEAEYSPAYALALGYVNNFLAPVITQLLTEGEKNPVICVYRPKDIMELFQDNLDRVKAEIRNRNYILSPVQLDLKHGRARDVLTIQKSKTKKVYFDFPNTLTSLIPYIDYKVRSREDQSNDKQKEELMNELIEKFYEKVNELTAKRRISQYIKYCDHSLQLAF